MIVAVASGKGGTGRTTVAVNLALTLEGEALAPPLIRAVRDRTDRGCDAVLVDSPPGTSCPMVAAVRGADLAVLVTEPTPFGHHDLVLAAEAVRALGVPARVVLNRAGSGDRRVHDYCAAEGLEILLGIPDDRRVTAAAREPGPRTPARARAAGLG